MKIVRNLKLGGNNLLKAQYTSPSQKSVLLLTPVYSDWKGPLGAGVNKLIFHQILYALRYLNACGMLHRDV